MYGDENHFFKRNISNFGILNENTERKRAIYNSVKHGMLDLVPIHNIPLQNRIDTPCHTKIDQLIYCTLVENVRYRNDNGKFSEDRVPPVFMFKLLGFMSLNFNRWLYAKHCTSCSKHGFFSDSLNRLYLTRYQQKREEIKQAIRPLLDKKNEDVVDLIVDDYTPILPAKGWF